MEIKEDIANEFAHLLIMRGFGLYGDLKMVRICEESGIHCSSDGSFSKLKSENLKEMLEKLMINYSKFNLPAKMSIIVLAKKFDIPIPDELKTSKKKKSKYRSKIDSK